MGAFSSRFRDRTRGFLLGLVALAAASLASAARADDLAPKNSGLPVLFTADEVSYDQDHDTVSARGNVEISQENRTLIADFVSYNQRTDILTASGNLTLFEPTGEVWFAEYAELTGNMKDAVIHELRLVLTDQSRMAAAGARRSGGEEIELRKAVYSPCKLCPDDPKKPPLWQIKAVEVKHDKSRQQIEYKDAWLEMAGLPVGYIPYLSHPDPTVKRRTGFLAPAFGGSSDLGLLGKAPFYWLIDDNIDATLTPVYMSKEGPLLEAEYRHNLASGRIRANGSITKDSKDKTRGHIIAEGRYDIDDTWRAGVDIERVTDDTYLRRYEFGSTDMMSSQAFVEGFRKRNYFKASAHTYQGLKVDDDPGLMPWVGPWLQYSHIGEADGFGGRTHLDASLIAITRTDSRETRRLHMNAGWKKPSIGPMGGLYTVSLDLRGDLYHVSDRNPEHDSSDFEGVTGRVAPQAMLEWRHPFIRRENDEIHQLLEPMGSVILSPNASNTNKIPNDDSEDFEFSDSNLFAPNRFNGIDRIEGGPRVNYGLKWGLFGGRKGNATVMMGQSYRFKKDDTFFEGSGLEDHFSDIVGRVAIVPNDYFDLEYRTRLNKKNFDPRSNEVLLNAGVKALRIQANYAFIEAQADDNFFGREEISLQFQSQLTKFWRGTFLAVKDLNEDDMRHVGLGLIYEDECLVFSTKLTRSFFEDRDYKPSHKIMFGVTLKTLGEVKAGS